MHSRLNPFTYLIGELGKLDLMNFIRNIEIINFKSIRRQRIERLKRINILIGYPNVGKSNLLEAIGLFSAFQLKNEYFRFDEVCRVKHFSELFFNQDSKARMAVSINDSMIANCRINDQNQLDFYIDTSIDPSGSRDLRTIFYSTINNRDFVINYTAKGIIESDYNYIIGPIKKYEFRRDAVVNGRKPYSLAMPYGNNLLDVLQQNAELRKMVATIFDTYNLKLFIDTSDESIKFLKELTDGTGVSIPYHQIADTLRRLIFYKAAIVTNSNSIIVFEEPEAHMFPPYIKRFTTDVIFSRANQFFIATHSPYVLDSLIEDAETDIAVYLVDFRDGETQVIPLDENSIHELRSYGVDLFFNIESYLKQWTSQ